MTKAYERQIYDLDDSLKPSYFHYDFAKYCGKDNFDALKVILQKTSWELENHGFFAEDTSRKSVTKLQRGVIRTNCLDSLDRTNVT